MAMLRAEGADSVEIRNANALERSVSNTPKSSFPKSAHLLKHSSFQRVYQQGKRHFSGNMTVFYLWSQAEAVAESNQAGTPKVVRAWSGGGVRVGFTVSKALGGSVERNRMRRRTREAVRHHLRMLEGMSGAVDVVINPKKSLLSAEFTQISSEIERAFRVIRQSCDAGQAKSRKQGERQP